MPYHAANINCRLLDHPSDPSSIFQRKIREAEATQPAEMTVSQLDEWLFGNLKEAFPKASDMELADLRIPRESLPSL